MHGQTRTFGRERPVEELLIDCHALWYASCMTVQIAVRLPEELIAQLDALVPGAHESRSQAVRRAIEVYLAVAGQRARRRHLRPAAVDG